MGSTKVSEFMGQEDLLDFCLFFCEAKFSPSQIMEEIYKDQSLFEGLDGRGLPPKKVLKKDPLIKTLIYIYRYD